MKLFITRIVLALRNFQQWLVAQLMFGFMNFLKLFPADGAIRFADRMMRRLGRLTGRHRLMLTNLRNAFPEKREAEIEEIALASWGNMGRLAAEYVFLDQLFDYDPEKSEPGRVEVSGVPIFLDLRDNPRPFIVFTGHTANFELLPVAGAAFGLTVTVLFRPPNNPYVAKKVFDFRSARMGKLVPSHAGSSFALARQLEAGQGVGVLVDQKFRKGLKGTFFGRDVKTNPLLPKLVRQFDCEVYPARCIRLPGNRYRLEIEPRLDMPRDAKGNLDLPAAAQLLNDKVESWVREYPEQWLWYHDRWQIKQTLAP
ncbi:lipid A biosynthesis lauroyl acyltransferase [Rhizobium leguminosarum]|uniref:Lipid A biosynthesis acyltransferase n=1 Tax=Rhizobium leguminosarum bv. trifolii (strain WSM1325) TaxID=395491 RepID=C6B0Y0_RHILS|nr:lipid A biosynthesis lauroyl acyltransferase [Rhizobium leguminosarum]ACS56627.1 lipid A biosynthesis acyltransferase [Rhizobium leguminosarum bv. trifolii WSM1325]MBY2906296.1 lipid A biosynthesis lauroyl acyltransferase [Rhizobium leguminosarum]MBY2920631.1 lipid A biosynthesis lauroyl acyltransferase [Rhizobium leguminosarum]MBY2946127.1 lipid A biosynthesis lauroyl acyltransferase [Rhizobium leguminosarum]MBY2963563.1 lipid A biosynthesis lauroyl acyltransferase [Rhizobium leguminosarum